MGELVNGARHDAAAFFISGIAERWADHLTAGGPAMIGDGGYQDTGPITPHKKPAGGELTAKQKADNYSVNRLRAAVERAILASAATSLRQCSGDWLSRKDGRCLD